MTFARESMPEKSWNPTKVGLGTVLSSRYSACSVYLTGLWTSG